MSRLDLFRSVDNVETWARTYGVQVLRDFLHEAQLDEASEFFARLWLERFDSHLRIAIEQGVVRPPATALRRADGVIQGPW
ncbi:MAG TPA: hypothetical protein VM491_06520 [Burkholderiaceae bacterium]|jgi:hypothetical protein|nr:hypothetical protein [Burkholderiaceae bacterium]